MCLKHAQSIILPSIVWAWMAHQWCWSRCHHNPNACQSETSPRLGNVHLQDSKMKAVGFQQPKLLDLRIEVFDQKIHIHHWSWNYFITIHFRDWVWYITLPPAAVTSHETYLPSTSIVGQCVFISRIGVKVDLCFHVHVLVVLPWLPMKHTSIIQI